MCKRLWISQLFFIVSIRRSCQPSLFFSLSTFTLTLVRRAASPSRKVSFTQKPAVYPPKARIFCTSLIIILFSRLFSPHQDIRIIILPTLYTTHPPLFRLQNSSSLLKAFHPSNSLLFNSDSLLFVV